MGSTYAMREFFGELTSETALSGAEIGLFTNTPLISPFAVLADFDPPAWTGYLAGALTFTGVGTELEDGSFRGLAEPIDFVVADPGPWGTVNGYYIFNTTLTPDEWLFAAYFDAPFTWTDTFQVLSLRWEFKLSTVADWGTICLC